MNKMHQSRKKLGASAASVAVGLAAITGLGCHPNDSVKLWVFNQTRSALNVAGKTVGYWSSGLVYVDSGDTTRLAISAGVSRSQPWS